MKNRIYYSEGGKMNDVIKILITIYDRDYEFHKFLIIDIINIKYEFKFPTDSFYYYNVTIKRQIIDKMEGDEAIKDLILTLEAKAAHCNQQPYFSDYRHGPNYIYKREGLIYYLIQKMSEEENYH